MIINSDKIINAFQDFKGINDDIKNAHFLMPVKFKSKLFKGPEGAMYTSDKNEFSFVLSGNEDKEYYTLYTSNEKIKSKIYDELIIVDFKDMYKIFCDAPLYIEGVYINPEVEGLIIPKDYCISIGLEKYMHKYYDTVFVLPSGVEDVIKLYQKNHRDLRGYRILSYHYMENTGFLVIVDGLKTNKIIRELNEALSPYFMKYELKIESLNDENKKLWSMNND